MQKLLYAASTDFVRTFGITFLAFAAGILGATNLQAAVALSIAATAASVGAGLRTLQVIFPKISFAKYLPQPWASYADALTRTFLATFTLTATGWLAAPNWGTWHAALLGALSGAAVAAVRALQGVVTPGESPLPQSGLPLPAHLT